MFSFFILIAGMSVDQSGSYDAALYSCIVMCIVDAILFSAVPIYQKVFAKNRYIMMDLKNRLRKEKDQGKPEQESRDKNCTSKTIYERVSTV